MGFIIGGIRFSVLLDALLFCVTAISLVNTQAMFRTQVINGKRKQDDNVLTKEEISYYHTQGNVSTPKYTIHNLLSDFVKL